MPTHRTSTCSRSTRCPSKAPTAPRRPRRTSRSPTSPRSRRCSRQARRAGTALPRARKTVWVTELNWESAPPAPVASPAGCRRCGSRALCTACGSPASGSPSGSSCRSLSPTLTLATPTAGRRPDLAPRRPLQPRSRRRPRDRSGQAVPARLHAALRSAARRPRARARVGAADAPAPAGPAAAPDARAACGARSPHCTPTVRRVLNRLLPLRGRHGAASRERNAAQRERGGGTHSQPSMRPGWPASQPRICAARRGRPERYAVAGSPWRSAVPSPAAGTKLIACSASAVIVRLGFTPTFAGIAEPSQTSRFS